MLAISQAAALKPEIRLQQALREYQSLLTKSQRQIFDARVRSGRPPDIADVIQATSEIDREARKQRGIHKCAAPRLMKVLTACQRFAAIGDVLIGGSQNLIACGVWSAVRLSLQISAGNGTFFDKLSLLIMEIGRTAPINEEIGLLVPDSPELQSLVAEYMLRVVSICKEMVKMSNRSSLAQLTSSISGFDTTFGQLSDEAKTIGHVIDKQIALLSAKTNILEARENQTSRALLRGLSSEARRQAREAKMVRFFKELCPHQRNFDAARANVRQKGTVDWIFKNPEYLKWKTKQDSSVLNLVGKLGSGKSVVMANVIDDLHLKPPQSKSQETGFAVAFMFYTHGLRKLCVARHIIGSLAFQILRPSVLRSALERFLEDAQLPDLGYPTVSSIVPATSAILRSLPKPLEIFVILDGLEECGLDDLNDVSLVLCKWKAVSNIRLMFSSRNAMDAFERVSSPGIRIATSQNENDLTSFISSETMRRGEICRRPPELCQLVAEVLSTGADGMYLWASLMLDLVFPTHSAQPTVLAIEDLLEELPKTLSEVYEKLLARVQDPHRTRRLFQLITVACRPLSFAEAIDALSVKPGVLARETIVILAKPVDHLQQLGGSLLFIEEEDETIHFIHDSAVSHLMVQGRSSRFGFGVEEAQRYMGSVCTTYLNLPEFSGILQKPVLDTGRLAVSPENLVNNAVLTTLPKAIQKPVDSLLSRSNIRKSRRVDMTRVFNELVASSSPPQQHLFHPYCKEFWLEHTKLSRINARTADRLWLRLMDDPGTLHFPWGFDKVGRLVWSLQHAHLSVLAYSMQDAYESADTTFQIKILTRITNHFGEGIDDTWLTIRDAFFPPDSSYNGDFLHLLIRLAAVSMTFFLNGPELTFTRLVCFLCEFGFPKHRHIGCAESKTCATPLGGACEATDPALRVLLVDLLLKLQADPSAAFLDRKHTVTLPLICAIVSHKEEEGSWQGSASSLLMDAGADVNGSTESRPYCPLIAACTSSARSRTELLKELLRRGADPYIKCPGMGRSVIEYFATESGLHRDSTLKLLSIMFLYRQQHVNGPQLHAYLFQRLMAEFLDEEVPELYYRDNLWIDHSAPMPASHRQNLEIALRFDGLFQEEPDIWSSAHLKSLISAHEKNPAQAPTQSLMHQIYTNKRILFSQRLRVVHLHLDGHLMNQLLHWIVAFGHVDTILEMAQNPKLREQIVTCRFLLHRAVLTAHLTGNPDCLTALLDMGRRVDEPGPHHKEAPLFWAVWLRNQELVSLLIRHGAQVGAVLDSSIGATEINGSFGPVLVFDGEASSYRVRGVTHLHQHRATSHLCGWQPLLAAILIKDSEMVCLLLKHHAWIDYIERPTIELLRGRRKIMADGLLGPDAMKALAEMSPQSVHVSDPKRTPGVKRRNAFAPGEWVDSG